MTTVTESLARPLRPALLAAARSPRLEQLVSRAKPTAALARRFVGGNDRVAVLPVLREILASGRYVTVDYLGEDTTDPAAARATVDEYLLMIADLATLASADTTPGSARPVEVSVKLTALGLTVDPDLARRGLREICEAAALADVWVTVDAEDATTAEITRTIVSEFYPEFPTLGLVVQAYLRDSGAVCRERSGRRIRLCKGAYREAADVAYQDVEAVNASYLGSLRELMAGTGYPMVASHDPLIIEAADGYDRPADRWEHQMLFGIRDDEQRRLIDSGSAVRVYVPYGTEWYGYFMRRLAERPANLMFFLRALTERRSR
ncbi:proline dehydrogenase family protein [Millisia brevis]|uniref:proline dehydrogenase family protein n=1 Tax=Millisia brevis TaxID=264148 RepID=UPI0008364E80|nr:proline dehydrogenase family protein [Millisia brevis]